MELSCSVEQVEPENHEIVSIFFADVVNYTVMCSTLRAEKASKLYLYWNKQRLKTINNQSVSNEISSSILEVGSCLSVCEV